jgi:hypothetical protein
MNNIIFPELQNKDFESLWYDGFNWEDCNHEKIIDQYRDKNICSLILISKHLNQEVYDNPDKIRKEPKTNVPKIMQHMISNNHDYPGPNAREWAWVEDLINAHYPNLKETDSKKFWHEFDYYIECYTQSFIVKAEKELMYEWAFEKWANDTQKEDEEDFNEGEEKFIQEIYADEYEEVRKKLYLPEYTYDYYKRLELFPKPISLMSSDRSYITQFFMIDLGDKIKYGTGRGSGSGTRFNHGIFGHLFAQLTKEGKSCRTIICELDSNMELKVLRDADKFLLHGHHLTGNYPIDRDESEEILKGIELINEFDNFDKIKTDLHDGEF